MWCKLVRDLNFDNVAICKGSSPGARSTSKVQNCLLLNSARSWQAIQFFLLFLFFFLQEPTSKTAGVRKPKRLSSMPHRAKNYDAPRGPPGIGAAETQRDRPAPLTLALQALAHWNAGRGCKPSPPAANPPSTCHPAFRLDTLLHVCPNADGQLHAHVHTETRARARARTHGSGSGCAYLTSCKRM